MSALDDARQREATAAAIAAARRVITGGTIPSATPISRLSEIELGWLIAAALFGWIAARAEQVSNDGLAVMEDAIRTTGAKPEPWDAGAVAAMLPALADKVVIDWSQPLAAWPRDTMVDFLALAFGLIRKAVQARDLDGGTLTQPATPFNDVIPF